MKYTVQSLADLAGVSVRTLHYYDEIGLLKPSMVARNGYRYYEEKELLRLQQILFFRELEFPLDEIKRMMSSPYFDPVEALRSHRKLIEVKKKRLEKLLTTITKSIKHMTQNQKMKDEEMYDAFKDPDVAKYQNEARERWGNTDAYKQSMAKVSKMTKAQMEKLKEDSKKFTQKLADAMDKGMKSKEVQDLIAEHYKGIQFFYDCPLPIYRTLGQMYVDDPRFTVYYDTFRPGLAVFMRDAITYFCDTREQK